jgi:hypothetical protein
VFRLVQPLPVAARHPVGECRPPRCVGSIFGCSVRRSHAYAVTPAPAGAARDLAVVKGVDYKVLFA